MVKCGNHKLNPEIKKYEVYFIKCKDCGKEIDRFELEVKLTPQNKQ